ncbi:MAG: hypothetical protein JRJ74_12485, partial [Deltaproteobacteria bacterium]|nr:hypothetical protein [Deltaproteobacteria bacterium]
ILDSAKSETPQRVLDHAFEFLQPDPQIAQGPALGPGTEASHKPEKFNLNHDTHLFFLHDAYHFSIRRFKTFRSLAQAFCNVLCSITPETD